MINIEEDKLRLCAEQAKEMAEHFQCFAMVDDDRKHLDNVISTFSEYVEAEVIIRDLHLPNLDQSSFPGTMLPNSDGRYEIYVLDTHDENQRRIIVCKEMFQVILDIANPTCRDMNIYSHVAALVFQGIQKPTEAVVAEYMAETAAMQFLYPYNQRVQDCQAIKDGTLTYARIAEHYGIPVFFVEQYLSAEFMEALQKSHSISVINNSVNA